MNADESLERKLQRWKCLRDRNTEGGLNPPLQVWERPTLSDQTWIPTACSKLHRSAGSDSVKRSPCSDLPAEGRLFLLDRWSPLSEAVKAESPHLRTSDMLRLLKARNQQRNGYKHWPASNMFLHSHWTENDVYLCDFLSFKTCIHLFEDQWDRERERASKLDSTLPSAGLLSKHPYQLEWGQAEARS